MNQSTDFCAHRLIIARERRGFSQTALAKEIHVTKDAVSKMEGGYTSNPAQENVERLSFALQFPIGWFYQTELELFKPEDLTFRARRKMTAKVRQRATRATDIAVSVISPALRSRFKFPECELPDLSGHSPEEAAMILRNMWKLGQAPIPNMVHLLENHGIEVYWLNEPTNNLDAWSIWRDKTACVVLNTYKTAGEREQFDAAHELAHLVLHRAVFYIEDEEEPRGRKAENEANQFASAFLLPRDQFRIEAPKIPILQAYLPLKKRWHVSIAAMIMRSRELGILSDWHVQNLFRDLAMRGWRKSEPGQLPRQQSRLHQLAFDKLAAKDISSEMFSKQMCLPIEELHELAPTSIQVREKPTTSRNFSIKHLRLVD